AGRNFVATKKFRNVAANSEGRLHHSPQRHLLGVGVGHVAVGRGGTVVLLGTGPEHRRDKEWPWTNSGGGRPSPRISAGSSCSGPTRATWKASWLCTNRERSLRSRLVSSRSGARPSGRPTRSCSPADRPSAL